MIDAGISLRRIRTGLKGFGLSPDDIHGVLLTHAHTDHISGAGILLKYHKIPVFASAGAAQGLEEAFPETGPFINAFEPGAAFDLGGITVKCIPTPHDASGSVGFTLSVKAARLAYFTDLGRVTGEILDASLGAGAAVIEANHDLDMLKSGPYPQFLKRRILSDRGHLANKDCAGFAVRLFQAGLRHITLAHLSKENNTPEIARATVAQALVEAGATVGAAVTVDVAPPDTIGAPHEV